MRVFVKSILVSTVLVFASATMGAADFIDGVQAAQAGDFQTALQEWKPLAEQGHVHAQVNLGVMYYNGDGIPQDFAEAARLFRMAAEQGDAQAQYILGSMHQSGKGVTRSFILAYMWYDISVKNGFEQGEESRRILTVVLPASKLEEAQRLSKRCLASNYQDCDER